MAENSKIEWTHHTFNPWIGCTEVSAACDLCYARELAKLYGWAKWGNEPRHRTSPANWQKPLTWDRKAKAAGERHRVFCASLADVFDNQVPVAWRRALWGLIAETPHLDWLLLTKRPQNIGKMLPMDAPDRPWPWPNVWLGTTAENGEEYLHRWRPIAAIPSAVRFISGEPLFSSYLIDSFELGDLPRPDWFIAGGESGRDARPTPAGAFENMRDQCSEMGIAFFMKQMTKKAPIPPDLMVRQFPKALSVAAT